MKCLFQIFLEVILVFHLQNIKNWDEFRSIYFASFLEADTGTEDVV